MPKRLAQPSVTISFRLTASMDSALRLLARENGLDDISYLLVDALSSWALSHGGATSDWLGHDHRLLRVSRRLELPKETKSVTRCFRAPGRGVAWYRREAATRSYPVSLLYFAATVEWLRLRSVITHPANVPVLAEPKKKAGKKPASSADFEVDG